MGTIIKSIAFQNFYNYYGGLEDNKFCFTGGINIISADNNMGKSKFYNGILWILKDQVYDSDDKKFKPVGSSYIRMASSKAKTIGEPFNMAVRIEYTNGDQVFEVSKTVRFQKVANRWECSGQTIDVVETSHGATTPVYDTNQQNKIIDGIIPVQLRDYALLQGESMEAIVDLSSKEGLQTTIENLADIGDIVKIRTNCTQLSRYARNLYNEQQANDAQQNSDSRELVAEKERLEQRLAQSEPDLEAWTNELSLAIETKEKYEALIENASSREQYRADIKRVTDEIGKLKEEKKQKQAAITSKIYSDRPWLLIGHGDAISVFVAKRDQLTRERTLKQVQDQMKKDPSTILLPEGSPDIPSLRRMLRTERCEVCGRPAERGSQPWLNIQRLIERPKENMPKTANDFNKFFSEIQISAGGVECDNKVLLAAVASYRDELASIEEEIENKQTELDNIRTRFYNAGGTSNEESKDKANLSEYNLASRNITKYTEDIEKLKETRGRWEARIAQIDEKLASRDTDNSLQKYQDFRDLIVCVEQLFESAKDRIFDRILDGLRKDANEKYKDLLKGNPVEGGTLTFEKQSDGTVHVSIKNAENGDLTGLGTGFQRMKQLSIIMAIISTKVGDNRFDYPFISDAPFSEFGDNFIKNFFRIAPKVFTQSIIMVKDLYDVNDPSNMNPLGHEIYNKMKNGEIPGTFYVNYIEERSDVTSLITKTKKYI
jgi:DNA sulfur modification protein DndD